MRAITVHAYGGADAARVEERPVPVPGPADVQVAVAASSLNPLDFKARTGELRLIMRAKLPKVLGGDFSGTVSAVGMAVKELSVGDEVFGCVDEFANPHGSHAEFCVVPAASVSRKPPDVSHEHAAALTMAGLTAWQALATHARTKPGQRVLVIGGSGGVGSFAVQVARTLGAHVTATAGRANLDLLRQLGAHECVDYRTTDYAALPGRFDVVFDAAAASSYFHARPVLAKGGTYLTTLPGPAGAAGLVAAPMFGQRVVMVTLKLNGSDGEQLAAEVSAGRIRPVVSRTLTLDDVPAAIEAMRRGDRTAGKQVVRVR